MQEQRQTCQGRVLVVDDITDNVELLGLDLEDAGYEIIAAYSGEEALECAEATRPDAILLDVMMPGIDGYEVTRRLKARPELAQIPVILLTARGFDEALLEGFEAGAHDYLTKPYQAEVLLARLGAAVRVKRAHDTILEMNRELERARNDADRASRFKSEFLSSMSHELRTPLNGVIGMTDLALETDLPAEARQYISTAHRCGQALLSVINDILDFSKIEAGKIELECIDFDLRGSVEEALEIVGMRAHDKGLTLTTLFDHDVPGRVRGDPARIRQILLNLLNNAIKFTEEGGVTLRVVRDAGESAKCARIRFEVVDTGIGIPRDRLCLLFESFSQVDASTTRKYGGTGLGLAICNRLVRLMEGEIGVESTEGQGSTFWFALDFTVAEDMDHDAADRSRVLEGLRVLTVGSRRLDQLVLSELLSGWICECAGVDNFEDAKARLREAHRQGEAFPVVVLEADGQDRDRLMEFAIAVRDDETLGSPRILLLTNDPRPGDAECFNRAGVSVYLPKPYKAWQLHDALLVLRTDHARHRSRPLVTRFILSEQRRSRVRILLAEADPALQRALLLPLRQLGFHCDVASTVPAFTQAVGNADYDLTFLGEQVFDAGGVRIVAEAQRDRDATARLIGFFANEEARVGIDPDRSGLAAIVDAEHLDAQSLLEVVGMVLGKDVRRTCEDELGLGGGQKPSGGSALRGRRILLVDDSIDNRVLARAYLAETGCIVEEVANGREAVEKVETSDFDLILMDMLMPVMDGYAATQAIRLRERELGRPATPILALTASAFHEDVQNCIEVGCNGHVAKPMTRTALIEGITAQIGSVEAPVDGAEEDAGCAGGPEASPCHPGEGHYEGGEEESGRMQDDAEIVYVDPDLRDIVPNFVENRHKDLPKLRGAIDAADFETVRTLGHNMKGAGAGYGFSRISELGASLEHAGKNADAAEAGRLIDLLEDYLARLQVVLDCPIAGRGRARGVSPLPWSRGRSRYGRVRSAARRRGPPARGPSGSRDSRHRRGRRRCRCSR